MVICRRRCGCRVGGSCHCEAPSSVRSTCNCLLEDVNNIVFFSINLVVVTPLCENLPGPSANKPGDMYEHVSTFWNLLSAELNRMCSIYAMNGKSVEIDNTDAEGRLILSGETLLVPCLLQA